MNKFKLVLWIGLCIIAIAYTTKHQTNSQLASPFVCPSCDLSGQSFKGQDLSNANFLGAKLDSADFSQAILDGAIFSHASLRGAIFDGASLKASDKGSAVFYHADLTDAQFDKTDFINTEFQFAMLTNTSFVHTDLQTVRFGPDIKYRRVDTLIPPLFKQVTLSCEFPWLWDNLNLVDTDLPACRLVNRPGAQAIRKNRMKKRPASFVPRFKNYMIGDTYSKVAPLVAPEGERIYVSTTGVDSEDCGSSNNPCNSITYGMNQCQDSSCNVLVEWGEYYLDKSIHLRAGINLYGGYVNGIASEYKSAIFAPSEGNSVFYASGLKTPVTVNGFILNGAQGSSSSIASKVIKLKNNSVLQLEAVEINAGKGWNRADGADGVEGEAGPDGTAGTASAAGKGGKGPNSYGGSGGGPANFTNSSCDYSFWTISCDINWTNDSKNGKSGGSGSTGSSASGSEGASGTGHNWGYSTSINNAKTGGDGIYSTKCGQGGTASTDSTGTISDGNWSGTSGGNSEAGGAGGGGGGGGSGGPCVYCNEWCSGKTDHTGTAGGGGGAGGEGGTSAKGGAIGGPSFGLMLINSTVIIGEEVRITSNAGGDGGNGGNGAAGGAGGNGGKAQPADGECGGNSSETAGSGGKGGSGGYGAASGGAAGGNGGPSIGVALSGDAEVDGSIIFYTGISGIPGKRGKGLSMELESGAIIGGTFTTCTSDAGEDGIEGIATNTYQYNN